MTRRVLMVWLDAYDPAIAEALIAEGRLPAIARLARQSARFAIDHGMAKQTGLGGEHVSAGLAPEAAGRHSGLHFNAARYLAWQEGVHLPPFAASLKARTVVFDAAYFDMARAPNARGLIDWGGHDPGSAPQSRPEGLRAEIEARFGAYPREWVYGRAWHSAERARGMGAALARGADMRAAAACWLLQERLPDWDLAIVGVAELHTATEALWHGWDKSHRLAALDSAASAREALIAVYEAVDRLIGRLAAAFPDAIIAAFALHGMGVNRSDVAGMVLLPELLFRHRFGRALLRGRAEWDTAAGGLPRPVGDDWAETIRGGFDAAGPGAPPFKPRGFERFFLRDPAPLYAPLWPQDGAPVWRNPIDWQAANWYRAFWPRMRAFALPTFYYGRVRINLAGREAKGRVSRARYEAACDAIERLIGECRDLHTGEPVVENFARAGRDAAPSLGPTECDLGIFWRDATLGFVHPRFGRIGPVPYNRVGGHTGGPGVFYLCGPGIAAGDYGAADAFDVAPTAIDLLGEARPARLSGTSLVPRLAAETPRAAAA
jgi:hypothetical protein